MRCTIEQEINHGYASNSRNDCVKLNRERIKKVCNIWTAAMGTANVFFSSETTTQHEKVKCTEKNSRNIQSIQCLQCVWLTVLVIISLCLYQRDKVERCAADTYVRVNPPSNVSSSVSRLLFFSFLLCIRIFGVACDPRIAWSPLNVPSIYAYMRWIASESVFFCLVIKGKCRCSRKYASGAWQGATHRWAWAGRHYFRHEIDETDRLVTYLMAKHDGQWSS